MIKSFQVTNSSPQEFIDKVSQALSGRDLGKIASMAVAGNDMIVTFSKMGKSKVTFQITKENSNFSCNHKAEEIALMHRPLRNDIESKLAKVLESAGAIVAQG